MPSRSSKPSEERRAAWRLRISLKVETKRGQVTVLSWTDNIGGGGLRFVSDVKFEPGEKLEVQLPEFSSYTIFPCKVLESNVMDYSRKYETRLQFSGADKKQLDALLEFTYRLATKGGVALPSKS